MKYQEALDNVLGFKPYLGLREMSGHPLNGLRVVELTDGRDCDILKEAIDKANKYDEKETPKKATIEYEDSDMLLGQMGCDYYMCSNCGAKLWEDTEHLENNDYQDAFNQPYNYCHCCGQRLEFKNE